MGASLLAFILIVAHSFLVLMPAAQVLENDDQLFEFKYQRPKLSAKGHVFCDQCRQGLQSNKTVPLQDVEVSIKCHDLYGFVTFSAIGWTNEHGAFTIPMDDIPSINGMAGCKAKLVRSMNEHCDSVSNMGGGQVGAPLLLKSKSLKLVVFTAGPFAYHPSSPLDLPMATCQQVSRYPPMHSNVGATYYASPPPPPPLNHIATYLYISPPPPPSPHLPPPPSFPRPPPPPPPPPPSPPPYWYISPPPSPFYWYKSPPPPYFQTHSSPPPSPLHKAPYTSPISYTHHYRYHHRHHSPPLPPRYYYSSPPPPPLHSPPPPPYHYISPPPTISLQSPHPPQTTPPPYSYHYNSPPTSHDQIITPPSYKFHSPQYFKLPPPTILPNHHPPPLIPHKIEAPPPHEQKLTSPPYQPPPSMPYTHHYAPPKTPPRFDFVPPIKYFPSPLYQYKSPPPPSY